MIPSGLFFLLMDITRIKNDVIDAVLLVYGLDESISRELNLRKKPLQVYNCQFLNQLDDEDGNNKKVRPYRIWLPSHSQKKIKYQDPRLLKKLLKRAAFTVIPKDVDESKILLIREMYREMQFKKIFRSTYCYLCRKQYHKYIFLSKMERIPLNPQYGQYVCGACGWKTLLDRLERKGYKITAGLQEILSIKFKKIRDIDRIERNFDRSWNPVEDDDFSLFDVQDVNVDGNDDAYKSISIHEFKLKPELKRILRNNGIDEFLPVQVKAINAGLLDHRDMLVSSSTSSGKTLIGELAGITNLLANKSGTFLFVVPLVALANQKYEEFRKKYEDLGIKVFIRVGRSRIDKSANLKDRDVFHLDRDDKNIIVGTYEGVDYLFRAGKKDLIPKVDTIVIDEIQMFKDEDRGTRLDGFIARLKYLYPNAQTIYLSATVENPKKLAKSLKAVLVEYFDRPVPMERHLIPCLNDAEKLKLLVYLVKKEFNKISSFGFKGQSIIFTNSRRSVHDITNYLRMENLRVEAYHSGLTYGERKRVERDFESQKIAAVVTTAALGAGVDLPASQVIFHSLAMGINWLTVAEFKQMTGRAGRYQKHDLGKVYLLFEPGKSYHAGQGLEEDKVAIKLLTGKMEPTEPPYDLEKIAGEILAFISMQKRTNLHEIKKYHGMLIIQAPSIIKTINYLHKYKLISVKDGGANITIKSTGKAISESFLDIEEGILLKQKLASKQGSPLDLATSLKPLKNVYVTKSIVSELMRYKSGRPMLSSKFFDGPVLDFLSLGGGAGGSGYQIYSRSKRKKLSRFAITILTRWATEIFTCDCEDRPYCSHGINSLANIILQLRYKNKMHPRQISIHLKKYYEILIYTGDIYDFLDNVIHGLEAVQRFASILKREKLKYSVEKFIKKIEDPL
ncbi:MAG: DEAD/DEAH box helicase [Promethearchaeota archaeon]